MASYHRQNPTGQEDSMVQRSHTGPQFEDEVRNIARNLYSNGIGQGSQIVDGRERDGGFFSGSFYTVVEATTEKTKDKAERDGKKTHELVTKLRQSGNMAQGILVTLHEPTPDQKDIIKSRKYDRTIKILSFDEFRSQLFDECFTDSIEFLSNLFPFVAVRCPFFFADKISYNIA